VATNFVELRRTGICKEMTKSELRLWKAGISSDGLSWSNSARAKRTLFSIMMNIHATTHMTNFAFPTLVY
jgi:hypothetical protein